MKTRILIGLFVLITILSCQDSYETKYHENGTIKSKAKIKNGVYDGDFITYYPDGKLKSKGVWKNGLGNGYIERYFENGVIMEKANWKANELHGNVEVYYPSGSIRLKAHYESGCKVGDYLIYHKSGEVSERHIYGEDCNLYYLVKFTPDGSKELELVFPIFDFLTKGDSVELSITSKIQFDGSGALTIGEKKGDELFPVLPPITITDTLPRKFYLSSEVDLNGLYYEFDFVPSESDTIGSFMFEGKLVEPDSTESNDKFVLDFS